MDFIKSRETGGFGKDASAAAASGASPPAPSGSSLADHRECRSNRREGERQAFGVSASNSHASREPRWGAVIHIEGATDLDGVNLCLKAEISRCALNLHMTQERPNRLQVTSSFQNVQSFRPA